MTFNDLFAESNDKHFHGFVKPGKFPIQNCTCGSLKLFGGKASDRLTTHSYTILIFQQGQEDPACQFIKLNEKLFKRFVIFLSFKFLQKINV